MKLLLFATFFILSLASHAQEAYILTVAGEKITIDTGEYSYDTGKKIKYYRGNTIFPKTLKTADVKEIVDGKSIYKILAFDDKKKDFHLYKVVAASPNKTLYVRFVEPPANASSGSLGAEYYITGAGFEVIASGEIGTLSNKKRTEQEKQAAEMIVSHFASCKELVYNLGKGITLQPDGTQKPFSEHIPLGFKSQKGIIECD
jgi:hypothetical protein